MSIAHTKIEAIPIWKECKLKGWKAECPYCGKLNKVFYDENRILIGIVTVATTQHWCVHSIGSSQYEGEERKFTFLEKEHDHLLPLSFPQE